jgi:hypothetical protein
MWGMANGRMGNDEWRMENGVKFNFLILHIH